jgi:Arc/MetJ-type ribon-helix-helix transcriptional regulator
LKRRVGLVAKWVSVVFRLPPEMAKELDELVAKGRYRTRSEAVRFAVQMLLTYWRWWESREVLIVGYR